MLKYTDITQNTWDTLYISIALKHYMLLNLKHSGLYYDILSVSGFSISDYILQIKMAARSRAL
jgi:hypothetical protein